MIRLVKFHPLVLKLHTWFMKSSVCALDPQFLLVQFSFRQFWFVQLCLLEQLARSARILRKLRKSPSSARTLSFSEFINFAQPESRLDFL